MIDKLKYWLWLRKCKDYRDVQSWLKNKFIYDFNRLYESHERVDKGLERIRAKSPEVVLKEENGICYDAAVFSKYSLNKINPNYKAEIIYICVRKNKAAHVVCGFYLDGSLYIMDYGRGFTQYNGIYGPFENEKQFADRYILTHATYRDYEFCQFGWPQWRLFEPW